MHIHTESYILEKVNKISHTNLVNKYKSIVQIKVSTSCEYPVILFNTLTTL